MGTQTSFSLKVVDSNSCTFYQTLNVVDTTPYQFLPNGFYFTDEVNNDTFAYVYGEFTGYTYNNTSVNRLVKLNQDLTVDSPYNTYLHRGLPPTPIAMVSRQSLDAAANPEHSNYLYFYAKGDGSHQFSETYEAQRQAIQQYKPKNHHKGP